MKTKRRFRGGGFKHNLGSVWPFSGIWIITVVLLAPILTISMRWGDVVPESSHADIWSFQRTPTSSSWRQSHSESSRPTEDTSDQLLHQDIQPGEHPAFGCR
jgi:hypothetical protein